MHPRKVHKMVTESNSLGAIVVSAYNKNGKPLFDKTG